MMSDVLLQCVEKMVVYQAIGFVYSQDDVKAKIDFCKAVMQALARFLKHSMEEGAGKAFDDALWLAWKRYHA